MATPDEPAKGRIVVAVDASAASRLALELAADLAAALGTRLTGLYVEEQGLLHAAGLPFVRSVGAQSGRATPFTPDELERQWRALAVRARDMLMRIADARQLDWSFEVTRGPAGEVLRAAARGARLMGLGIGERPSAVMAQAALRLPGTPLEHRDDATLVRRRRLAADATEVGEHRRGLIDGAPRFVEPTLPPQDVRQPTQDLGPRGPRRRLDQAVAQARQGVPQRRLGGGRVTADLEQLGAAGVS